MNQSIEKHAFKISIGVAVLVIVSLISMAYNFATWKSAMESDHNDMAAQMERNKVHIQLLEDKANGRDIELAKINTKLASIESLLLDIRVDIKEIQRTQ